MAIENNAAVNMGLQVSHWDSDFTYFGCISRRQITGSNGSSIYIFWEPPPILFSLMAMWIYILIPIPIHMYKEGSALWLLVILPANPQLQYGFITFTLNLANALRIKQLWVLSLSFWVLPYPRSCPKKSVLFLFVL